ncbi:hypothetical protein [Paracoccus aminovorans]|uniref:hypothetical protein n=1 Tax=Paracoccus aminovorans TaxID=34004 RepID=UPI0012E3C686|nr:hypothetical protein [Paracoccus aminovorans]
MARDRRDIADREDAARTADSVPAPPADKTLAGNRQSAQHPEHLLAFVRALARDAARADHAAERGAPDD